MYDFGFLPRQMVGQSDLVLDKWLDRVGSWLFFLIKTKRVGSWLKWLDRVGSWLFFDQDKRVGSWLKWLDCVLVVFFWSRQKEDCVAPLCNKFQPISTWYLAWCYSLVLGDIEVSLQGRWVLESWLVPGVLEFWSEARALPTPSLFLDHGGWDCC